VVILQNSIREMWLMNSVWMKTSKLEIELFFGKDEKTKALGYSFLSFSF